MKLFAVDAPDAEDLAFGSNTDFIPSAEANDNESEVDTDDDDAFLGQVVSETDFR